MGEKITQAMSLEVWNLTTPAEMFECLEELAEQGYRGNVAVYDTVTVYRPVVEGEDAPPPESARHWLLELNSDDKPSVNAAPGQVVVLFGGALESMTSEAYASRFNGGQGDAP
jgi:hypothetical protein